MEKTTSEVEEFQVEKLKIQVHPSREAAGLAAAKATADAMKAIGRGPHPRPLSQPWERGAFCFREQDSPSPRVGGGGRG